MKNIILFSVFIFSMNVQAATLQERVRTGLNALEAKLGTGTPKQKAASLLRLEARKEVFALQLFGRLFEDDFKYFISMKKDFKKLEDVIGQAKKWQDLLDQEDLSAEKKSKYSRNLKEETQNLSDLLAEWDKESTLKKYHKDLSQLNLDEDETTELVVNSIKEEIRRINEKDFDFTYGETGLHELRRNLRWPVMEFEAFKDLFTTVKVTTCASSKNDLYNLGLKSKYIAVKSNKNSSIEVDYCSYIKTLGAVELLGELKDDLEKKELIDDELPADLRKKTESIYKEIAPVLLNKLI